MPILESVLTCPRGGYAKQKTMLADACQFFYEYKGCNALLRLHPATAVFCFFGTVKCPPM
ncbi:MULTISPECIES: GDCCVxC domain-containing (seleno)protein [Nitrosospira]|uniref:GDCCVxC domain-containing (seleno)protein n=1 Tax=Nitrosospira TaxID=35798 RepID=UPI0009436991|nr:GDCCVxC domain-containing (seleno)protein [Nitrosospira sp. Nsp5]